MKLAYIAGPYRASTVHQLIQNIQLARDVAAEFWKMGYAVICPHLNSGLMDGVVPDQVFLDGDREFIRRMGQEDVVVLLPGWSRSEGARKEFSLAVERGLAVAEWSKSAGKAFFVGRTTVAVEAAA